MQLLYRTVIQLEEAKHFILDGDVERLRLALILLDNAAETIMNRFIDGELRHARTYAQLLKVFPTDALDIKSEALKRNIEEKIVPSRRQKKIEHNFDEKLTYLSNDCRRLPPPTARALRRLHKYRNETQHRDLIREGSIRPAVLVLFDIAVDLLVSLHTGTVWASNEDYGWLLRYGFSDAFARFLWRAADGDDLLSRIATGLRYSLQLDTMGIRRALVTHLTDRLDAMNNHLMFVANNWFVGPDLAHTLEAIQFCHPQGPECEWQEFEPTYDLDSFTEWRDAAEKLNSMDKLVMFGEFATIEVGFEPLEAMIEDAASEIDRRIQEKTDLMRGK